MRKKIAADNIKLKRAYEPAEEEDGQRILVDRLWPRGLSKADSKIDEWIKDIAPSTTLRKWFGHEVARWEAFHDRYRSEEHTSELQSLMRISYAVFCLKKKKTIKYRLMRNEDTTITYTKL